LKNNKQNINHLKSDSTNLINSNLSYSILKNEVIIDNNEIEVLINNKDFSNKNSSRINAEDSLNKLNEDISQIENEIEIKNNVKTENVHQTFENYSIKQSILVTHECNLIINVDDEEGILKMHKMLFKR